MFYKFATESFLLVFYDLLVLKDNEIRTVHARMYLCDVAMAMGNYWWLLLFMSGPGPYEINISSSEGTLTMTDVMFGDVWLCSGQSNMQFTLSMVSRKKIKKMNKGSACWRGSLKHRSATSNPDETTTKITTAAAAATLLLSNLLTHSALLFNVI